MNNEQIRIAPSGFPLFKSTRAGTTIVTNPETGKSIVIRNAGASKDLTVTDNGDGTITLRTALTGLPEQITLSDGTVALRDAGRVIFATVLDYNGTPTNVDDDVLISEEIESISGPHPAIGSGFELFCAAALSALT